jgi:hypothetical protein
VTCCHDLSINIVLHDLTNSSKQFVNKLVALSISISYTVDMDKFNEFVSSCGGARKAAQALDVSESLISLIKLGQRNISYRQAQKIESITSGRISRKDLRPDIYG